jgi:hypothetical protein
MPCAGFLSRRKTKILFLNGCVRSYESWSGTVQLKGEDAGDGFVRGLANSYRFWIFLFPAVLARSRPVTGAPSPRRESRRAAPERDRRPWPGPAGTGRRRRAASELARPARSGSDSPPPRAGVPDGRRRNRHAEPGQLTVDPAISPHVVQAGKGIPAPSAGGRTDPAASSLMRCQFCVAMASWGVSQVPPTHPTLLSSR